MSLNTKQIMKALAVLFLLIVFVCAGLVGLFYMSLRAGDYQQQYRQCDPKQLLTAFGDKYGVNLPHNIVNIKAAKTIPIENSILFIIKFEAKSDDMDIFIKSFSDDMLAIEPYEPWSGQRARNKTGFWRPPKWFREPITQGERGYHNEGMRIYIDTSDKENFVVYLSDWY